jgi:(1->4)-alpha-D-glucan 1-alpha-D-glucosylmutase
MLGSSTHDTKRSEDVRARLAVLSELASGWRMTLRRWAKLNRSYRGEVNGEPAPSAADEYHYYQALIGIWPGRSPGELAGRLKAYMLKAAREAKLRTSWINPDADYEAALERFVTESLKNPLFLKDAEDTVARVAHLGLLVGLSQALLKVASPGVPDYYQGTELWDFSLVDPDNRRPVDYERRKKLLQEVIDKPDPQALLENLQDGRAKLHVIRTGLALRKRWPTLFQGGEYLALYADGAREENVCAFALRSGGRCVIAVAPRLFARLMQPEDRAPLGERVWGESCLTLPESVASELEDVLTGRRYRLDDRRLRLAEVLGVFPVALLAGTASAG